MHVLFTRIRNLNIPIYLQLFLFDHVVYLLHYIIVKYGALKIAKLLKIYIMFSLDRLLT